MVVRLLMHPVAENVFICLSVGLVLLSVGLIGSVFWTPTAPADGASASAQVSVAAAIEATPVSAPTNRMSLACAQHSGFVARAAVADCQR